MPYHVECPCGRRPEVEAWSAGGTAACTCGRSVDVPSLSNLRRGAGLPAYREHPAHKIARLRATGELPAGPGCARCGDLTEDVLDLIAECESPIAKTSVDGQAVGVALVGLIPVPVPAVEMTEEWHGQIVNVSVPVRLCAVCRRPLWYLGLRPLLRYGAVALIVTVWAAVFVLSPGALLLLPAVAGVWLYDRRLARREQVYLQASLRQIDAYRELFERYPSAVIRPG